MIKSAHEYPISSIFDIELKTKYFVPKYQREYAWRKEHWEALYTDLMENDNGHFLGSIIMVNRGTDALSLDPLEIIDGQQRLTTIALLYAAIYAAISLQKSKKEEIKLETYNLKKRLLLKGKDNEPKLQLSEQKNNEADFREILRQCGILSGAAKKVRNIGNRRISKAYQYLRSKLDEKSLKELFSILDRLNSALVVKIEVDSHASAFVLFESLNNRGLPLSAMDLIKNNILANLENKKVKSIDEAFTQWKNLIDDLSDPITQERFLRQYYNAFMYKDKVKLDRVSRATRSNLIKIYDRLIDRDVSFIFDELVQKAELYSKLVEPGQSTLDITLKANLTDLIHIGASPSFTMLLYLLSEHGAQTQLIAEVVEFLVKYFVRRNLTDFPETRLDQIFIDMIEECRTAKGNLTIEIMESFLSSSKRFAPLERLKEGLAGPIYDENVDAPRFILSKIEESHMTKENYQDLWKRDQKGNLVWTIEHVFPEGDNIPDDWVKMIAAGDIEKAEELQEKYVHTLGNLTLTGYNSKLFNRAFGVKRDWKDSKTGAYIGYKNGLYLNKDLRNRTEWTVEAIDKRTNRLIKEALSLLDTD